MSPRLVRVVRAAFILASTGGPLAAQDSAAIRARELAELARQVDELEAAGDWRAAIAPLDRLLALESSDPFRLRQRGLYAAWSGDRERGIALLRRAARERPRDPGYLAALAEVLSWSAETRKEASRTFAEAIAAGSPSLELLLGYADLLSWTPETRDSAALLYRTALSRSSGEPRARVGLANLQAWRGDPAGSLLSYDSVLATSAHNVAALRGRGGALNQLGRHDDAARSLTRALELDPADHFAAAELARAELGTGRYRAARSRLQGPVDPMLRSVADSALRATASAFQVSAVARRRAQQLDLNQWTALAVGSIGAFKFHGEYQRNELEDALAGFRDERYGGGVRVDHRDLAFQAGGRLREVRGLEANQWDGAAGFQWRIAPAFTLAAGASRVPVEETRRSVQGEMDAGLRRGVVHANLARVTVGFDDLPGPLDAELSLQGGHYTGTGLEANRRLALDARAGLLLHRSQPWVRLGYGFAASRFEYNAALDLTQVPHHRGGYFSPAAYRQHQGIVQLSQRFGARVRWEADARIGREWVRQLDDAGTTSRTTTVATTTLSIRLARILDLEGRFLYVNAFDAFEMKEVTTLLKVYLP